MATLTLERRVMRLEDLMAELTANVNGLTSDVRVLGAEMRDFKDEMRDFKDEMRDFKDEMRDFKDEMRDFKDEMRDFKDEMRDFKDGVVAFQGEMAMFKDEMRVFKDEMTEYKEENRRQNREMNRRWGELSNKMGLLVENIVAPSIPRVLRSLVACPDDAVEFSLVRFRRTLPGGASQEYDVVAGCGDFLLINETKSNLRPDDPDRLVEILGNARTFLPEFANRQIVGALASLYVDPSVVQAGEARGLAVLGMAEDSMDLLNSPGFRPRIF